MKDDDAIPLEPVTDEATEARIVAWVLGEASAFEITELERLCVDKPELEIFRRRMLALQGLLKDSASETDDAEWKLPTAKRERVIGRIGGEVDQVADAARDKRVSHTGLRVMFGIAACLVVTFIVTRLVNPNALRGSAPVSSNEAISPFAADSEGKSLDELRKMVREQEDRVEQQRRKLSSIVRTKGIVYRGDDPALARGDSEVAAKDASQLLTQEKIQLESQIQSLLKYKDDQLLTYASGLDLPENTVKTLYPQYLETRRELEDAKNKGLGERHPDIQKLTQQTENLKKDLDEETRNLRATLEAQTRLTDARLAKVETLKGEKKDDAIQRGLDTQDYVAAKQNFETELEKLQKLKLRMVTESAIVAAPAKPATVSASVLDEVDSTKIQAADFQSPAEPELAGGKDSRHIAKNSAEERTLRRKLYMAEGNFNLGKYDDAKKSYEEALKADPYNAAARRGLERLAIAKSDYYRAAYDHTRSELLSQVDNAWELSVPVPGEAPGAGTAFGRAEAVEGAVPDKKAKLRETALADGFRDQSTADAFAPADPAADVSDIMTGGLRSGDQAITRNNIDAILNNPNRDGESPSFGVPGFLGDQDAAGAESMAPAAPASAPAADPFVVGNESLAKLEAVPAAKDQVAKQLEEKSKLALEGTPAFDAELIAAEEPFSTFSLNVSDVSFQLAKAALERGEQPAPESIKVEQFYNAVDYGDAAPSAGEPVAGVVEQSVHPIIPGRNLVRMGVRTAAAGRSAAQPLRLTLLVDQSGSMVREDRKAAMEKAVAGLGQLLTEADRISVIGFSRVSRLIAEDIPGNKISELGALVNPEASEGGTNLEEALKLSELIANRHKLDGAQNRVVLFTDGAANLGDADPARLAEKVKAMRQSGIAFDVAGIGAEDLNDRLLAELARNGNGRYYVAADNLAAQLAGAFRPAAEDVKVQVMFNPQRVNGYRLVGFEESRLKTEDFRNDAIDAAELAAEEAAVALYQVEVLPGGAGEIGEMSVRFREAGTGNTVERSWTIPYDAATPAFDKATPSMKLAGLSMLAAEKLKGGPLADVINFRELAGPLADAKRYYKDSNKVADMTRVIGLLAK